MAIQSGLNGSALFFYHSNIYARTKLKGIFISAVIFNWFEEKQLPLINFSMTRATSKGKGQAKNLLRASLSVLNKAGNSECCLFVTEGNEPAISIYKLLGFKVVI